MLMQYTANFKSCKNDNFLIQNCSIFLNFAQNIDYGYTVEPPGEAVLTSTHNLCFRAKIRKIMYTPVNPSLLIYKKWVVSGLHYTDMLA